MNVKKKIHGSQEIRQARPSSVGDAGRPPRTGPCTGRTAPATGLRTVDRARAARAPALVQSVRPGHNATHTAAHVDGSLLAMLVAPRSALSPRSLRRCRRARVATPARHRHTARRIHTHTHGNMHKIRTRNGIELTARTASRSSFDGARCAIRATTHHPNVNVPAHVGACDHGTSNNRPLRPKLLTTCVNPKSRPARKPALNCCCDWPALL